MSSIFTTTPNEDDVENMPTGIQIKMLETFSMKSFRRSSAKNIMFI